MRTASGGSIARAAVDTVIEDPFEQTRPPHARRGAMRVIGGVLVPACIVLWTRHDHRAQRRVGREHAVEANQMQARTRDQSGESLAANEVQMLIISFGTAGVHVASGKLRALAVAALTRLPVLPNVPTTKEVGLPEGVILGN